MLMILVNLVELTHFFLIVRVSVVTIGSLGAINFGVAELVKVIAGCLPLRL
jgi:hypothetical protein